MRPPAPDQGIWYPPGLKSTAIRYEATQTERKQTMVQVSDNLLDYETTYAYLT
jgi:hypothetical protein